jgi:signal transduction histidine kinase
MLALSTIACIIVLSNWLVQHKLHEQLNDSRVINVAGRQRMLSQKLSKAVLLLTSADREVRLRSEEEIRETLSLWTRSHTALLTEEDEMGVRSQNSAVILSLFEKIDVPYTQMVRHGRQLLEKSEALESHDVWNLIPHINAILAHEQSFVTIMDQIVNQYDLEAKTRVDQLIFIEKVLTFLTLAIILLEIIFIFRPISRFIKKIIYTINQSRSQAIKLAEERAQLIRSLRSSRQKLTDVYAAIEKTSLLIKTDACGQISYISQDFCKLMGYTSFSLPIPLSTFLHITEKQVELLLVSVNTEGTWSGEIRVKDLKKKTKWLYLTILPVRNTDEELYTCLLLATDITDKKDALRKLHQEQKARRKQLAEEQRMRSILVINAQENDRKHIAMELHDNIGQSLTALKYYVEALCAKTDDIAMKNPLGEVSLQLQGIIKNVRRTSFSLMPSVLERYGIASVLQNFASEMQRITGKNIIFDNESGFNKRLSPVAEANIYRIVQECVNNALKYAEAGTISICLRHAQKKLELVVTDDGRGFDLRTVEHQPDKKTMGGHGISNIRERTKYMMGRFLIYSKIGEGTKIHIQLPLSPTNNLVYGKSFTS